MVCVQDHGDAGEIRGQPREGAGLGRVRVHDVGSPPTHQGDQLAEGDHVVQAPDLPAQDREHEQTVQGFPLELEVVPLRRLLRPCHEERVVARRIQPFREQGGVDGGATDVESRDHPKHADALAVLGMGAPRIGREGRVPEVTAHARVRARPMVSSPLPGEDNAGWPMRAKPQA